VSWVLKMALDLPFFLGSWWKCSGSWSPEVLKDFGLCQTLMANSTFRNLDWI
jgi:hypothetical protein